MYAAGKKWIYWDEKVSAADMDRLWMQNEIKEEWLKSGESVGKVRFARDSDLRPYLTRIELKVNISPEICFLISVFVLSICHIA